MLRSGSVAGLETSPEYILANSYNADASYLTSYAVIPKFETIVATQAAWRALTAAQQAAIRQAAADTLVHARQVPARESQELAGFCRGGLIIDQPSPAQLADLARETRGAVPAGVPGHRHDPDDQGRRPRHRAAAEPNPLPPACRTASTAAQAIALHRLSVPGGSGQTTGATIPPGTYVTTDTVADWRAGGQYGADWNTAVTYTWHLYPNGKVYQTQKPVQADQPFYRGRYIVKGDEVTFIWDAYMGTTPETVRWSYFDGQLTFSIVHVQDTGVAGHLHRAPMAQGQLTAAAGCAAVLAAGVLAELASPSSATLLTGADYAVGAGFALTGAWLLATDRGSGLLSLATAASWFAGTAAAAVPGLPAYPGNVAALAYRGFLVHLLARGLSQPRQARGVRLLILGGYLAVLLPAPADSLVTAALIAVLASSAPGVPGVPRPTAGRA